MMLNAENNMHPFYISRAKKENSLDLAFVKKTEVGSNFFYYLEDTPIQSIVGEIGTKGSTITVNGAVYNYNEVVTNNNPTYSGLKFYTYTLTDWLATGILVSPKQLVGDTVLSMITGLEKNQVGFTIKSIEGKSIKGINFSDGKEYAFDMDEYEPYPPVRFTEYIYRT